MAADDIVTRLRNWVLCTAPTEMVMLEAADEIERLRAEVTQLNRLIHFAGTITHEVEING